MKWKIGLGLLYVAGSLVIAGSMYDLFVPTVPSTHLAYLGVTPATMDPRFAALDLGLLRALGGCLLAIGQRRSSSSTVQSGVVNDGQTSPS